MPYREVAARQAVTVLAHVSVPGAKREAALDEELADILRELKALKLYLSRYAPGFKEQFPSVQRKVR